MSIKKFGPYLVQDILGRGGMGTVYRATDVNSDEVVAVKALAPNYSFDERFRLRFEAEIEALIQLDHPNIVRLISYGQEEGNLFYAMELIDGQSLFELQKSVGKLAWKKILNISIDVARGLRHAHDRGIIHRDLKPGNLMLNTDGVTKLGDFGIAKMFGGSHMTADGNILGTMDFMAPEQAQGKPVTMRSDLYSLGVVLYALLTGKPPFSAESVEETVRKVVSAQILPIQKVVHDIPIPFATVINDLIRKDPDDRIQTAQALIHRLDDVRKLLVESAEAKTYIVADDPDTDFKLKDSDSSLTDIRSKTVDDSQTSIELTLHSKVEPEAASLHTRQSDEARQGTKEIKSEKKKKPKKTADYFSPVSDKQRDRLGEYEQPPSSSLGRIWPLALGLVVTLLLIGFGVYYQIIRPPSADTLIATIEDNLDRPSRVREELIAFIKYYPEHERASEFESLKEIADAMTYHLALQRRHSANPENLTDAETEFLRITSKANEDPIETYQNLKAFINLYLPNADKDERLAQCIEAAKQYLAKIRFDLARQEQKVEQRRAKLEQRIQSANQLMQSDPALARRTLLDLVEIYEHEQWADPLIENVRKSLNQTEKEN
jgi:serine/threonine protein kinase